MPLYYYRAPFTYKYTMTTLYIFYSYQSISNYTIYDYLYTITPYIWIYSMAIAHIYSIITLYIVTSCLPLAFRGFAAIGDWKGLSPSKHLYIIYFDDFLLILQKIFQNVWKILQFLANLTHSISMIISPPCNFQTSK